MRLSQRLDQSVTGFAIRAQRLPIRLLPRPLGHVACYRVQVPTVKGSPLAPWLLARGHGSLKSGRSITDDGEFARFPVLGTMVHSLQMPLTIDLLKGRPC